MVFSDHETTHAGQRAPFLFATSHLPSAIKLFMNGIFLSAHQLVTFHRKRTVYLNLAIVEIAHFPKCDPLTQFLDWTRVFLSETSGKVNGATEKDNQSIADGEY